MDLLDEKKQALIPKDQRDFELEQRSMGLLAQKLPTMYPEEFEAMREIMKDPEFQRQFMENYQKNVQAFEEFERM